MVISRVHFPVPGEKFEGKYVIDKVLGSGGFARVYLATEIGLERPVALKVLMPPNVQDKSMTERDKWLTSTISRFEREAQVLSKLRCAHTVTVYAFGRTDDGLMYMALEYVEGLNLTELTALQGALSPTRCLKILRQLLLSLQEAHAQGMLHRDIKPANIMVFDHMGSSDNVKLLDFGIAKAVGEMNKSSDLTGDGTLIGTPRYMSPEQIQGEPEVGPPSDIYSLGLVIYELLIGERAITVDNSLQVIGQQLSNVSFALPTNARVPHGLKKVVNRMLEKDLSRRYESIDQILAAISDPSLLADDLDSLPDITLSIEPDSPEEPAGGVSQKQVAAIAVLLLAILILVAINALRTPADDSNGHVATLPETTSLQIGEVEGLPDAPEEEEAELAEVEEAIGMAEPPTPSEIGAEEAEPPNVEDSVAEAAEAAEVAEDSTPEKKKVTTRTTKDSQKSRDSAKIKKKVEAPVDSLFPLIE